MPTNVVLNAGSGGERLATDEIVEAGTTAHAQYVKLLTGTAGATAAIGGTVANGLMVDVRAVSGVVPVSAAGHANWPVSGKVTVVGSVLVSAVGHVLVSGNGTFLVAGKTTVVADPQATFFVGTSADQILSVSAAAGAAISVSAQGAVNWPVSGKVSVVGSTLVSAVGHVLVSGDGNFAVVGKVTVVADPQATFFVTTSADRRAYVAPAMGLGCAAPASSNGTPNPLKYVYITASAAGDLALVASTASRSIRVLGYALVIGTSAGTVFFRDTEATTVPKVHGAFALVTGGGVSYAGGIFSPAFQTTVGAGVRLTRGAGAGLSADYIVSGHLTYIEVTN